MIVFWGCGRFCERILNSIKPDHIVDSKKYGQLFCGYTIQSTDLVKNLTSTDKVYITSQLYEDEIRSNILSINPNVKIIGWKEHAFSTLEQRLSSPEYIMDISEKEIEAWIDSAISSEAVFWDNKIKAIDDDFRLHEREFEYPSAPDICFKKDDIIIDLGCGGLPKFGNKLNGETINYIPADPLAHQYSKSRKKYGYTVPVSPRFAIMENLADTFGENYADYIIIHNAMDHCIDIIRAFVEAFRVLKIGGSLLLQHFEAECLWEYFEGLHKWGFEVIDGDVIVIGFDNQKINITSIFFDYADIKTDVIRKEHKQDVINVILTKKKELSSDIIKKYDDSKFRGVLIDKLFAKLTSDN